MRLSIIGSVASSDDRYPDKGRRGEIEREKPKKLSHRAGERRKQERERREERRHCCRQSTELIKLMFGSPAADEIRHVRESFHSFHTVCERLTINFIRCRWLFVCQSVSGPNRRFAKVHFD